LCEGDTLMRESLYTFTKECDESALKRT